MSIKQAIERFKQARERLIRQRQAEALRITLDAKALIQRRIQTKSENSEGSRFSPYTKGYAKYGRKAKGYQAEIVDFTRTGRMWANITPRTLSEDENQITVRLTARSNEEKKKLNGQLKKRGNILQLSDEELRILQQANKKRALKALKPIL